MTARLQMLKISYQSSIEALKKAFAAVIFLVDILVAQDVYLNYKQRKGTYAELL